MVAVAVEAAMVAATRAATKAAAAALLREVKGVSDQAAAGCTAAMAASPAATSLTASGFYVRPTAARAPQEQRSRAAVDKPEKLPIGGSVEKRFPSDSGKGRR